MPGYTHLQRAMPSTVALWALGYAETLANDLDALRHARRQINVSPLGSAAGYGVPVLDLPREAVADRLVQQHARPARAEHHRHGARRRLDRVEVDQRLAHRLARVLARLAVIGEPAVAQPAAAAGHARLAPAVALDDHLHVQAHQRPHVAGQRAVAGGDQDELVHARQARDHLLDGRIGRARLAVAGLQELDLVTVVQPGQGIAVAIQRGRRVGPPGGERRVLPGPRDRPCRARRALQRRQGDLVGIGEAGALPGHRPHADPAVDAVVALAHDTVLEDPALVAGALEIQVGGVHRVTEQAVEDVSQLAGLEPGRRQQSLARQLECAVGHRGLLITLRGRTPGPRRHCVPDTPCDLPLAKARRTQRKELISRRRRGRREIKG